MPAIPAVAGVNEFWNKVNAEGGLGGFDIPAEAMSSYVIPTKDEYVWEDQFLMLTHRVTEETIFDDLTLRTNSLANSEEVILLPE